MQDTAPDGTEMTGGWYDAGGNAMLQPAEHGFELNLQSMPMPAMPAGIALPCKPTLMLKPGALVYIIVIFLSTQLLMLLQTS